MRDKQRTIDALRAMAERPGSQQEGETARRLLALMGAATWIPKPFDARIFPAGAVVFYCYWCYRNERGVVCKQQPKYQHGQWWMRIKFDYLKNPRWVAVTSELGCHLGLQPFEGNEQETLYRRDVDWQRNDSEFMEKLRSVGISANLSMEEMLTLL